MGCDIKAFQENACTDLDLKMYELKRYWAKCYLNDTFFVGMTTGGRSESMHAFFDSHVNANAMLNGFVLQYDKALIARRVVEEEEDFITMDSRPILITDHPIEEMAAKCYTRRAFEVFLKEWKLAMYNCDHATVSKTNNVHVYLVGLRKLEKSFWRKVDYDPNGGPKCTCSCGKFETFGLLCRHALHVLIKKQETTILEQYILRRWTIDARYKTGNIDGLNTVHNDGYGNKVNPLRVWALRRRIILLVENASEDHRSLEELEPLIHTYKEKIDAQKKASQTVEVDVRSQVQSCVGLSQLESMPQISIRDPISMPQQKERPRNTARITSGLKVATNGPKRQRCSYCFNLGLFVTGCSIRKV